MRESGWGFNRIAEGKEERMNFDVGITILLMILINLVILGLNLKLYTEYFKDRSAAKRGVKNATDKS